MKKILNFIVRNKFKLAILVAVLLAIVFGRRLLTSNKSPETYQVSYQNLDETVTAQGYLKARDKADLHFMSPTKISWVGVKVGDLVQKGQVVATVDRRALQKSLQKSLLDYQTARWDFEQLHNDHNASGISLESALVSDTDKRTLQKNQFSLDKSVLDVQLNSIAISDTVLTSPISGIVVDDGEFKTGETISTGDLASRYIRIIDNSSLYFVAEIDEVDYGRIHLGQKATIILDAFPDQTLTGKVSYIGKEGTKTTTGSLKVKVDISLDKVLDQFVNGLNGEARITISEKNNTLVIPRKYITTKDGQSTVQVLVNNKPVLKTLKTGLITPTEVEVLEGLSEGDRIVASNS